MGIVVCFLTLVAICHIGGMIWFACDTFYRFAIGELGGPDIGVYGGNDITGSNGMERE